MVSSSKILTVSYGTFSCTLEGFDDSFDTMKAIAEYFRNLAADDRYFGAEPPTPDADMLARIAEREIARRVDASEQKGKIVLRAAEDATLNAPTEESETQGQNEHADENEAPAMEEAAKDPVPPADPVSEGYESSAKASDSRAKAPNAESKVADEPMASDDVETVSDPAISAEMADFDSEVTAQPVAGEKVPEPEVATASVIEPVIEKEPDETPVPITETEPDANDVFHDAKPADVEDAPNSEAATENEEIPEDDSVADRLRRIRSLVDESDASFQDSVYSEDEHAQDFLSETAADLEEALHADDAMETATQDETAEPDMSSVLRIADEDARDQNDAPRPVESMDVEPDSNADNIETTAPEIAEDTLAQLLEDAMPDEHPDSEPAAASEGATVEKDAEGRPSVQARVVKMKRSEFEASIRDGYLQEDEAKSDIDDNLFGDDSGLSAEEEAELQRELAEVEAEFSQPTQDLAEDDDAPLKLTEAEQVQENAKDAGFEAPKQDIVAKTAVARETDETGAEEDTTPRGISKLQRAERQADLARIFDEADTQLDEPESNQRRNAIQHLRAAVAATRAEKKAGASLKDDVDESPYRNDLANVVRPRRPEAIGEGRPRANRPNVKSNSPAPLKLVAEQRVDLESAPVRPRRISKASMADAEALVPTPDVDDNFTEFAEEMGATSLPELLEAAAAYMSDIEGRAQFSRPMLMGKLKEVEGREFSREDGLRSFGQLLRQGKLQKLKGGRFCVTDSTDFRDQERSAV